MKTRKLLSTLCCMMLLSFIACGSNDTTPAEASVGVEETNEEIQVVVDYTFDIPEGFSSDAEIENTWTANDQSGATIQYYTYPYSDSIIDYTPEKIVSEMESQFSSQGLDTTIQVLSSEEQEIDGCVAHILKLSYTLQTTNFIQTEVILVSNDLIGNIIYTDLNDSGYSDSFQDSIASIHAKFETLP